MELKGGYEIARYAQISWEDRKNVDGWPSRAGMYCNDAANSLCMRLIDYPQGSTEPRHVHAGTHATTVLKELGPWDFFYVSAGENHAPVRFPAGATLLTVTLR